MKSDNDKALEAIGGCIGIIIWYFFCGYIFMLLFNTISAAFEGPIISYWVALSVYVAFRWIYNHILGLIKAGKDLE